MEPNIFDYTDHKKFIKDYYDIHKSKNTNFSYRVFAKKAGFSSSGFLPMVISGKKTMSVESARRMGKAMGLSKKEAVYFESLVFFNQARDESSKEYYNELLRNIKKERPGTIIDKKQLAYLSNWYYPVIREMVMLSEFKEDTAWIRDRLCERVTVKQIQDALNDMIKLGILKRDGTGVLRQVETAIKTEDEVSHTAIFMFHHQMIMLARDVLMSTKGIGSEITGLTMPISTRQFKEIVTMSRDFQDDVIKYVENSKDIPDSVAQFNIQFFKVTN